MRNNRITYFEHFTRSFNRILAHLHNSRLYDVATRDAEVESGPMVRVFHESDEFGFLDLIKRWSQATIHSMRSLSNVA